MAVPMVVMAQPEMVSEALNNPNMPLYMVIFALLVVIGLQAAQNWMLSQAAERNINPDVVKDFLGFAMAQTHKLVDSQRDAIKTSKNPLDDIGLSLFDMLTGNDNLDEQPPAPPMEAQAANKDDPLEMVQRIMSKQKASQAGDVDKAGEKPEGKGSPRRK